MSQSQNVPDKPSLLQRLRLAANEIWPKIALWAGGVIAFWTLVVPGEFRRTSTWLPTLTPGQRTALLLSLIMLCVVAGWRRCFAGRGYYRGRYIRYLAQSVFLTPVLFGLVIFVLLAYVPQMREVYLGIIDEARWGQGLLGLASLILLCALLSCWQRSVGTQMLGGLYSDHADLNFDRGLVRVLSFKGNLASVLPLIGLFAGLAGLAVDARVQVTWLGKVNELMGGTTQSDGLEKVITALDSLYWSLPTAVFIAGVLVLLVMRLLRYASGAGGFVSRAIVRLCIALMLAMIVVPPLYPDWTVEAARTVGPLTVVMWSLISIVAFFALLSRASTRFRIPVTGIFLGSVGVLLLVPAMFGAERGDEARRRTAFRSPQNAEVVRETFRQWLAARPDLERYRKANRPYPVFIFAAAGGGIYAASAAATFLAEMQDDCASFSRHVFMVSGVSGGAVGASVFSALANAQPADAGGCAPSRSNLLADHTEQIIRSDHLSPVVAVLISDIVRKLVLGVDRVSGDRAEMLRTGFARAFAQSAACQSRVAGVDCSPLRPGKGLDVPFSEHWSTSSRGPALLLNTTWSETGFRVAFAPFPLHAIGEGTLFNFNEIAPARQVERSLIEAAVVSARFPGIVPAWRVDPQIRQGQRWNFVDGGYVDNSGSASALEVYEALSQVDGLAHSIDLRLVLLSDSESELDIGTLQGTAYSDTVAPLTALLKVRSQLSDRAIAQAVRRVSQERRRSDLTIRSAESRVWLVSLEQGLLKLPLGWKISGFTNNIVGYMMGRPAWCRPPLRTPGHPTMQPMQTVDLAEPEVQRALAAVWENSCVKMRIIDLLRTDEDKVQAQEPQGGVIPPR